MFPKPSQLLAGWRPQSLASLALVLGSLVLSLAYLWPDSIGGVELPGLEADPGSLDLGTVWLTHRHSHTLSLHNPSSQSIEILGFAAGCSCTDVFPTSVIVPPNSSCDISLHFNLLKAGIPQNEMTWPAKFDLTANIKGTGAKNWTISGNVKSPLARIPNIQAPIKVKKGLRKFEIRFPCPTAEGVRLVSSSSETAGINCRVVASELILEMTPKDFANGVGSAAFLLKFVDAEGKDLPPLRLNFPLLVSSSVVLSPEILMMEDSEESFVTLRSRDGSKFMVLNIGSIPGIKVWQQPGTSVFAQESRICTEALRSDDHTFKSVEIEVLSESSDVPEILTFYVQLPQKHQQKHQALE
jgi:hypothetical protein